MPVTPTKQEKTLLFINDLIKDVQGGRLSSCKKRSQCIIDFYKTFSEVERAKVTELQRTFEKRIADLGDESQNRDIIDETLNHSIAEQSFMTRWLNDFSNLLSDIEANSLQDEARDQSKVNKLFSYFSQMPSIRSFIPNRVNQLENADVSVNETAVSEDAQANSTSEHAEEVDQVGDVVSAEGIQTQTVKGWLVSKMPVSVSSWFLGSNHEENAEDGHNLPGLEENADVSDNETAVSEDAQANSTSEHAEEVDQVGDAVSAEGVQTQTVKGWLVSKMPMAVSSWFLGSNHEENADDGHNLPGQEENADVSVNEIAVSEDAQLSHENDHGDKLAQLLDSNNDLTISESGRDKGREFVRTYTRANGETELERSVFDTEPLENIISCDPKLYVPMLCVVGALNGLAVFYYRDVLWGSTQSINEEVEDAWNYCANSVSGDDGALAAVKNTWLINVCSHALNQAHIFILYQISNMPNINIFSDTPAVTLNLSTPDNGSSEGTKLTKEENIVQEVSKQKTSDSLIKNEVQAQTVKEWIVDKMPVSLSSSFLGFNRKEYAEGEHNLAGQEGGAVVSNKVGASEDAQAVSTSEQAKEVNQVVDAAATEGVQTQTAKVL